MEDEKVVFFIISNTQSLILESAINKCLKIVDDKEKHMSKAIEALATTTYYSCFDEIKEDELEDSDEDDEADGYIIFEEPDLINYNSLKCLLREAEEAEIFEYCIFLKVMIEKLKDKIEKNE